MKTYSRKKTKITPIGAILCPETTFDNIVARKLDTDEKHDQADNNDEIQHKAFQSGRGHFDKPEKPYQRKNSRHRKDLQKKNVPKGKNRLKALKDDTKKAEQSDSESSIEVLRRDIYEVKSDEIGPHLPNTFKQFVEYKQPKKRATSFHQIEISGSSTSSTDWGDSYTNSYTWVTANDTDTSADSNHTAGNKPSLKRSQERTPGEMVDIFSSTARFPGTKHRFSIDMSPITSCPKDCAASTCSTRQLNENTPARRNNSKKPLPPHKTKDKEEFNRLGSLGPRNSTVLFKSCQVDIADILPDLSSIHQYSEDVMTQKNFEHDGKRISHREQKTDVTPIAPPPRRRGIFTSTPSTHNSTAGKTGTEKQKMSINISSVLPPSFGDDELVFRGSTREVNTEEIQLITSVTEEMHDVDLPNIESIMQVPKPRNHPHGLSDSSDQKKSVSKINESFNNSRFLTLEDSHWKHIPDSGGKSTDTARNKKKLSFSRKKKKYGPFNICQLLTMKLPEKRKVARSQKVNCLRGSMISHETVPRCMLTTF